MQRIADTVWEKVVFGSRNLSAGVTLPNIVVANLFGSWGPEEAADLLVCEASWILCGGNSESSVGGDGAHVWVTQLLRLRLLSGNLGERKGREVEESLAGSIDA